MDSMEPFARVAPGGQPAVAVCVAEPSLRERICNALEAGGHPVRLATGASRLCSGRGPAGSRRASCSPSTARTGLRSVLCTRFARSSGRRGRCSICGRARGGEVRRALELGVDGVLLESQIETALAAVVDVVCAGQVSVPSRRRFEVTCESADHAREADPRASRRRTYKPPDRGQALSRREHSQESSFLGVQQARCLVALRGRDDNPGPRARPGARRPGDRERSASAGRVSGGDFVPSSRLRDRVSAQNGPSLAVFGPSWSAPYPIS